MSALLIGILVILFGVYAVIPGISWGLQWGPYVLDVLRGAIPLIALLIGLLAVLIGIADIKDKIQSKKEESEEKSEDSGSEAGEES